jgi:hypothetical protein
MWLWISPEKLSAMILEPACLMCSQLGKPELERGTPLPHPLERLDWRGVCKNGLQNLEPQGFAGQNLENTAVMAIRASPARIASALTMICF